VIAGEESLAPARVESVRGKLVSFMLQRVGQREYIIRTRDVTTYDLHTPASLSLRAWRYPLRAWRYPLRACGVNLSITIFSDS
jgi:hypothetical protein